MRDGSGPQKNRGFLARSVAVAPVAPLAAVAAVARSLLRFLSSRPLHSHHFLQQTLADLADLAEEELWPHSSGFISDHVCLTQTYFATNASATALARLFGGFKWS